MLRYLKKSEDFREFIELCEALIGVRFPESYLSKNLVAAFYVRGKMMGGFILAASGNLRALEGIPAGKTPQNVLSLMEKDEIFEVTGLWLDPSVKGWRRAHFWFELYRGFIKVRRSHFVFSYSLSKPKLGKRYQIMKPTVVYRGPVFINGMSEPDEESVELASLANVRRIWLRHVLVRAITKQSATWAQTSSLGNQRERLVDL